MPLERVSGAPSASLPAPEAPARSVSGKAPQAKGGRARGRMLRCSSPNTALAMSSRASRAGLAGTAPHRRPGCARARNYFHAHFPILQACALSMPRSPYACASESRRTQLCRPEVATQTSCSGQQRPCGSASQTAAKRVAASAFSCGSRACACLHAGALLLGIGDLVGVHALPAWAAERRAFCRAAEVGVLARGGPCPGFSVRALRIGLESNQECVQANGPTSTAERPWARACTRLAASPTATPTQLSVHARLQAALEGNALNHKDTQAAALTQEPALAQER